MSREIHTDMQFINDDTVKIICPYCEAKLTVESHTWTPCKTCGKLFTLKQRSWIEVEE